MTLRQSEGGVRWSGRVRGCWLGCCAAAAAVLGIVGCGSPAETAAASASCTTPPQIGPGRPLPYNLVAVSAARGTRQAWVIAGRYDDPFGEGNFLLHLSGLSWTKVATFGPDIHLDGVAALSATKAWVWGKQGHAEQWNTYRPYLALVSHGVVRQIRAGLPAGISVGLIASNGATDAFLAGVAAGQGGRRGRAVTAVWNGTSWSAVPAPEDAGAILGLSVAGRSDVWAVLSKGFDVHPWVVHWNGSSWSRAYTPPSRLATMGRVPQHMSAASSSGHVWVAYTQAGTNSGSNEHNPVPRTFSAYFDGGPWRMVPVPGRANEGIAGLTMSGGDAWAIAYQNINGILYSHLGGSWCVQHLPHGRHLACMPRSVSAASPSYVVAVTSRSARPCRVSYAYVYDHRWRTANSIPSG